MTAGLAITAVFGGIVWLVFFRLRLLRFTPGWGVVTGLFGAHLTLIFLIGTRFVAPAAVIATVVQPTIQLVPRLSEPTLVTEVLVQEGARVARGQPLFRFDATVYASQVRGLEARLAAARQRVLMLDADVAVARAKLTAAQATAGFARADSAAFQSMARQGAAPTLRAAGTEAQAQAAVAVVAEAQAELDRAELAFRMQFSGVNTSVAEIEAELETARYFLANTTLVAPEDGRIVNLQVRPGMVAGTVRLGAIAALIVEGERYVLATFWQQHLKYVRPEQPAEIALDLFPGQVFRGEVVEIWDANGLGQYLPSAELPSFTPAQPHGGRGLFAVRLRILAGDPASFPIGANGHAAIYTGGGGFAALRRISLRGYSWSNFLMPFSP